MSAQARSLVLLATLAAVLAGAAVGPAFAHTRPAVSDLVEEVVASTEAVPPASAPAETHPRPPWPFEGALALGVALAAALLVRRRGLVAGLALLVTVLAVEASVHSVHHLDDARGAAECVVAVITVQMSGTLEQPPGIDDADVAAPVGSVPALVSERPGSRPRRPDEGRAPPTA